MAQKKENIFTDGVLAVLGLPVKWAGKSLEKTTNFLFDSDGIVPVGRAVMYTGAGAGAIVGAQWGFLFGAALAAATGPVGALAAGLAGAAFGMVGGGITGGLLGVGATMLVTAPIALAAGLGAGVVVGAARSIVKALTPSTWFGKRIREKADAPAVVAQKEATAKPAAAVTKPAAEPKLGDQKVAKTFKVAADKPEPAANDDKHAVKAAPKKPEPPKNAA